MTQSFKNGFPELPPAAEDDNMISGYACSENRERKLANMRTAAKNNEYFIRAVRRFMEMDTLTAPLLKELIDRIEVSEVQGKGKNRTQRIVIHYRFAGYIDLERDYLESNIVQDTRKGVAVEYVPHAAGE